MLYSVSNFIMYVNYFLINTVQSISHVSSVMFIKLLIIFMNTDKLLLTINKLKSS